MFGAPKLCREDKSDYLIYYRPPGAIAPPLGYKTCPIPETGCQCVSIDPAIKNFAIRIENRFPDDRVQPIYFYRIDFMAAYPDEVEPTSKKVKSKKARINPKILEAILQLLTELFSILKESRVVIIERQMHANYHSLRVFQHLLTCFSMIAPQFDYPCWVFDVSAQLKGNIFGAPKGLTQNQLKQWDIDKALSILNYRGDEKSIGVIKYHRGKTKTKADDLADTVIQLEAFVIIIGGRSICYPTSLETPM